MNQELLKLGTRASRLALWQAHSVQKQLVERGHQVTIVPISTTGDQVQNRYLHEIGGKGLFVKEIEQALEDKTIDLAVHSLKDLPAEIDSRFDLSAYLPREHPHDVLIMQSKQFQTINLDLIFSQLNGAKIGTSSLRRQSFLKHLNPSIETHPLRGNVDTRLEKLANSSLLDGVVLAYAGLHRLNLNLSDFSVFALNPETFIPCAGQGIICVQTLVQSFASSVVEKLNDPSAALAARTERRILKLLGADCKLPFGCYAKVENKMVTSIDCIVLNLKGKICHVRLDGLNLTQPDPEVEKRLIEKMIANNLNKILTDLNLAHVKC